MLSAIKLVCKGASKESSVYVQLILHFHTNKLSSEDFKVASEE